MNRQRPGFGPGACLAALTTALSATFLFLLAFLVDGMRCDDGCGDPSLGWTSDRSAWQWDFHFWGLAFPGEIAALLVVVFLRAHRLRAATAALLASALLYAGWETMILLSRPGLISWHQLTADPRTWLPHAVMVLGGMGAIWVETKIARPKEA